jgi:hypothetical protein
VAEIVGAFDHVVVVRPEWALRSIEQKKLLPEKDFVIVPPV